MDVCVESRSRFECDVWEMFPKKSSRKANHAPPSLPPGIGVTLPHPLPTYFIHSPHFQVGYLQMQSVCDADPTGR